MKHVVFEGLPAVGKSEALELLARFYPERVRVLPELVKEIVNARRLDLFRDRSELTAALVDALPARAAQIREITDAGFLCLEESHLGVHWAYAHALEDRGFLETYPSIEASLPRPDAYVRLALPVAASAARQHARSTPAFAVDRSPLEAMLGHLDRWHAERGTSLLSIDADRPAHAVLAEIEERLSLRYAASSEVPAETFDVLFLLGRPASGKSEFIDFMTTRSVDARAESFHIGPFDVLDDFPILWALFEDDDLWEALDRPRLYSRRCNWNYAITDPELWPFLIAKLDRAAATRLAQTDRRNRETVIVEFSRGGPSGYADALSAFSDDLLRRAAILYVSVSFEESWRRNLARYDEDDKGGILTHSVPREEMEKTYGTDDWFELAPDGVGTIDVRGIPVPYATMGNEPESTDPNVLGPRYRSALDPLFDACGRR